MASYYRPTLKALILLGRPQAHFARRWRETGSALHLALWSLTRPPFVAAYYSIVSKQDR